jgi:hypothetical protein
MPTVRIADAVYRFVPERDTDVTMYNAMLSSEKVLTPQKSRLLAAG